MDREDDNREAMMHLGNKLKKRLLDLNMDQQKAADITGILSKHDVNRVVNWKMGSLSLRVAVGLAKIFNVNVDTIAEWVGLWNPIHNPNKEVDLRVQRTREALYNLPPSEVEKVLDMADVAIETSRRRLRDQADKF